MNETCMTHALNMPILGMCPYCRIAELEQWQLEDHAKMVAHVKNIDGLEDQNTKLIEALEKIVDDADCTDLEECKYVASETLKEIINEKNRFEKWVESQMADDLSAMSGRLDRPKHSLLGSSEGANE